VPAEAPLPGQPIARGRRARASEIDRRVEAGRWRVQGYYGPIRLYATEHGGNGPKALSDLDQQKFGPMLQNLDRSPSPEDTGPTSGGPYYFLVPDVVLFTTSGRTTVPAPATPLVVELRPYVGDGKHWVLLSNGQADRRP